MLVWLIVGINAASSEGDARTTDACATGHDVGTLPGTGTIVFFWAAGAVIHGVVWLVTNRGTRRRREVR
ncbi:hypothetical protein [Streptomyces sp. VRA16 Mangrove soil]|uniref:hypothetical protein n=1 Tax=Streptomyces sp. VRA16 Mangrove soil TaxID=2817434 RepID=UPI001A9D075E|nr:hypothetical protein [Streptomyces sp. VRA16 Mangrove soil]MBO1332763.1 hypothetical protein [Streptomyces sp. VRA16 Mangrove soil]